MEILMVMVNQHGFVFNANASNRFFVRIYHYYGHEKPNILLK